MGQTSKAEQAAYEQGFDARLCGKEATENPHRKLTNKWFGWADGWKDQDHHLRGRDQALDSIGWFG